MSERLTDEELEHLTICVQVDARQSDTILMQLSLLLELRERRARDLTDEDIDWLRKLRDYNLKHAPSEVLAVLDKLLGKGGA